MKYLRDAASSRSAAQAHLLGTGAVERLERKLAAYYGKRHALCVCNATSGLFAIALALELKGKDVISSPLTWGGTIAGPLHAGARPVFADVDPVTLALHPDAAEAALTRWTKAILAVDLFGVPADDVGLRRVADQHNLWYIHDAAQSFGATRDGRPAGALADAVVVSFTCGKALFAGEGGAILTDHDSLYESLVWSTQHPYRHKLQLGLDRMNELALNLRIHPLAAVWADAAFASALRRVTKRRNKARVIVDAVESSGLIQPLPYGHTGIQPSCYRLTAAWRAQPQPQALDAALEARRLSARVQRLELGSLYRLEGCRTSGSEEPVICIVAEDQVERRFEISF